MRFFRICMVIDALDLGGAETHVVTLANQLSAMGHEVTVVSSGGRLTSSLAGVRHITRASFKKANLPNLFFWFWRFFRKEKFDVIHAHTRLSAFLCRPFAKKRLVTTVHWVFDTHFPKKQFTHWGEEALAVSPDIARYLSEAYGYKKERVTVTVNGIDHLRFAPEKTKDARRHIVCCTRMDADRADAAFALLEAAKRLPSNFFSLTLVGDGDRFTALKEAHQAVKKEFPTLDIRLVGGVADVAPYLKSADIFVGVSRAALEGMAAGCAVILAGNEGYLSVFHPRDAKMAEESNFCCRGAERITLDKLTRDLLRLLRLSREALYKMGEDNRRYILARYTAERMASDAVSVYERICKRVCVLCGYYGFGNLGDALLSRALTRHLQERGYRRVLLLSAKRLSPRALLALARGYDLFLGGGNLLQDATSRRSLGFYLFCAKRSRRIEIYGGLGPLSKEGETRVARLLARASLFHARTSGDLAYAKRLGAQNVRLSADTALALPFPKKEKGKSIPLCFRAPKGEEKGALFALISHLLSIFPQEELILYAMHPDDRGFAKMLAKKYGLNYFDGGEEAFLALLAHSRLVIATRLHAGVCALGVGVPFLLFEGEEKCRFFVEDVKALAEGDNVCGLFSLDGRFPALPDCHGIEKAREKMRKRI